jgi:hypothetical protein
VSEKLFLIKVGGRRIFVWKPSAFQKLAGDGGKGFHRPFFDRDQHEKIRAQRAGRPGRMPVQNIVWS